MSALSSIVKREGERAGRGDREEEIRIDLEEESGAVMRTIERRSRREGDQGRWVKRGDSKDEEAQK